MDESKWSQIKVGDILKITKNEVIPADILIIKSSLPNGFCYMQTTNLDGESALKRYDKNGEGSGGVQCGALGRIYI